MRGNFCCVTIHMNCAKLVYRMTSSSGPGFFRFAYDECAMVEGIPSLFLTPNVANEPRAGMSLGLLKFSGGSVDDYAICRSS